MSIKILALEKDLFFSVRMRDTLRHHDMEVNALRSLNAFEQRFNSPTESQPALVIVDIATVGVDWEAVIRLARQHNLPVLAFGSHMDLEARERALKAGAQKVVANSKFSSDMPGLVQRILGTKATEGEEEEGEEGE